jgi:hypothetical protein
MTPGPARSSKEDGGRRSWFTKVWTCCLAAMWSFVFLAGIGIFVVLPLAAHFGHWDQQDPNGAPTSASSSPSDIYVPVTWTFAGVSCADGWQSSSVGHSGACSHHGGVISNWQGSNGQVLSCAGVPPIGRAVQEQQIALQGALHC